MTSIAARLPKINWNQDFKRHWNGGSPAATHAFNALSFLFPQAERFFVEVVREVAVGVDLESNPELREEVNGFIVQESIHARQHTYYNAVLRRQGYDNVAEPLAARLQEHANRHFTTLTKLAVVCAYEHYTAILGNYVLCNPQVLRSAQPDIALIWGWHGAEETEHKSVCFRSLSSCRWPMAAARNHLFTGNGKLQSNVLAAILQPIASRRMLQAVAFSWHSRTSTAVLFRLAWCWLALVWLRRPIS